MSVVFNKQLLFENIGFLVRERGLKIGELETAAGVSPGYISRTSKDGGPTPGIEFVVRVASELKVSIDTLISTNLADITPTERYLIGFLDKLVSKTGDHQMIWCSVTEKKWREEADNGNPLFRVRKRPTDGSSSNYPFVLLLNSLEEPGEYMPYGPCYYLNLSPNDILWITRILWRWFYSNCSYAKCMAKNMLFITCKFSD